MLFDTAVCLPVTLFMLGYYRPTNCPFSNRPITQCFENVLCWRAKSNNIDLDLKFFPQRMAQSFDQIIVFAGIRIMPHCEILFSS